jgi:hypothetical protein
MDAEGVDDGVVPSKDLLEARKAVLAPERDRNYRPHPFPAGPLDDLVPVGVEAPIFEMGVRVH